MAPPKPRKDLARAAARASHWAFGVEGQSEKQHAAALKNYDFIQDQLRKTGGELTDRERGLGKEWLKRPPPKPIVVPKAAVAGRYMGEAVSEAGEAARERNIARGAKPTGGMGRAERERFRTALDAAKTDKQKSKVLLEQLGKAGFELPPTTAKTQAQADAYNKQTKTSLGSFLKEYSGSERAARVAALAQPFNFKRNIKLIGQKDAEKIYGVAMRAHSQLDPMRPVGGPAPNDWAHKAVRWWDDHMVSDREKKLRASLLPDWVTGTAQDDLKELTANTALAIPAIGEVIFNDFTGKTRGGIPKTLYQMGKGWAQEVEKGVPLDLYTLGKAAVTGDTGELTKDIKQAQEAWTEHPFTTGLNVIPGMNALLRGPSIGMLAARIAKLNPELTPLQVIRAARKENYAPGWAASTKTKGWAKGLEIKGGIPDRVFRGKIIDDLGNERGDFTAPAKTPSRTVLGRTATRAGMWAGRSPVIGFGPFSETSRAAASLRRVRGMSWERKRLDAMQLLSPIEKYIRQSSLTDAVKNNLLHRVDENRTRMIEVFYGPQMPEGLGPVEALQAIGTDLKAILDEGGIDIPTEKLGALDKELGRLNAGLEKLGLDIDYQDGLWAEMINSMRQTGMPENQIYGLTEIVAARARVWAAEDRVNRHPQDYLESPEGRNLAGVRHGTPDADLELGTTLYQKLFPGEQPRAGKHIPRVTFKEEKTKKNLSAKKSKRKGTATGVPDTPDLYTNLDDGPVFQIAGDITPEEWVKRVESVIPDAAKRDDLARWYEHYVPMFRRAFGKDANAIMRGFAVSQANASPASGLASVLRVMDAVREGKNVGKTGFGSVVSEAIAKAVKDGEIDKSIAAKLSDFIDSLEGRSTRRWMKDHPDGGMPAAVDVHAIRDRGYVDKKLVARMKAVHGFEEGKDFVVEGTGAASGGKYERIAEWYGGIANHLNDIEFDGRADWTPAQAQALGWSAIQLAHKVVPEGFVEAFARNTREITFEPTKGPGRLGNDLTLRQSRRVARAMVKDVKELVRNTPGLYLVDAKVGTGGWNLGTNANISVRVMGTKQAVQDATTLFAQAFDQEWVQATREISGSNSRATLLVQSPRFKSPDMQAKFFAALNRIDPKLEGFMEYDAGGQPTIAIRTKSASVSPKTQAAFVERHRKSIEQAEAETGIPVSTGVRNVEMLTGGQYGEVAPIQTLPGSSGRGIARDSLDNPAAASIRGKLESTIDDVRGGPAPAPGAAGPAAAASKVKTLYQGGRFEGYKPNPEADTAVRIKELADRGVDRYEIAQTLIDEDEAAFPGTWEQIGFDRNAVLGEYGHEIDNFIEQNPGAIKTFEQADPAGDIKGAAQFLDSKSGKQLIYLSEHADGSTFLHEMFGHAAHEMKAAYPDEFAALEKRYGKSYEDWSVTEHEKFATETERYFMSGKAPIPELQPLFDNARKWMYHVYETIKALGRPIHPETRYLLDRYFGKTPLEFEAPKRLTRRMPAPGDNAGVGKLVRETSDMLRRKLDADPARRLRVGGNMRWLEEQVLPFMKDTLDPETVAAVHSLFNQFDEVKRGDSIFSPEESALLRRHGETLHKRYAELDHMATRLASQPDQAVMHMARELMDTLDDPDLDLEGLDKAVNELAEAGYDFDRRRGPNDEAMKRLSRQVKDIERALKTPRNKAERDAAIMAMREMSDQMKQIYLQVFGENLTPEEYAQLERTLTERDNLLPRRLRELGLIDEGTGDAHYVPHYSLFDVVSTRMRDAVRLPAAGGGRKTLSLKPRADSTVFSKGMNKTIRYQTGELALDPRALFYAYKNRLRFVETSMLRKELWDMGVPIDLSVEGGRIPRGWYVINGSGKHIPERLQAWQRSTPEQMDEMLASGEDFDSMLSSEEGIVQTLDEYQKSFLHKSPNGEVPRHWDPDDKLRMLPPDIVEKMVDKVFETPPGGKIAATKALMGTMGRFATIYAHPVGYIGANVAANTMMLGMTHPGQMVRAGREFLPPSMSRALEKFARIPGSLRASHPELYARITTETGDVMAEAGIPDFYVKPQSGLEKLAEGSADVSGRIAGTYGRIADQPFRVAAWTGEAKRYGYTDVDDWERLLTDPELEGVRNTVAQRARDAMLDFNKLSPSEKIAARWLFIWPFVRASVAWPFYMLREYPGRLLAVESVADAQTEAYEGTGIKSAKEKYNEMGLAKDRSMFDIGQVPMFGGTVNLSPINPIGPLAEKVVDAGKLMGGDFRVLGQLLNPSFREAGNAMFSDRGFDAEKVAGAVIPGMSYVNAWRHPKARGAQVYEDRDSFWDYLRRREGRFFPEDVSGEKIKEAGEKERKDADKRPSWEKDYDADLASLDKIVEYGSKHGDPEDPGRTTLIKKSITAYNAIARYEHDVKEQTGKSELDEHDKLEATYKVVEDFYPEHMGDWPPLEETKSWPEKSRADNVNDVHTLRMRMRDAIGGRWHQAEAKGREWGVVE